MKNRAWKCEAALTLGCRSVARIFFPGRGDFLLGGKEEVQGGWSWSFPGFIAPLPIYAPWFFWCVFLMSLEMFQGWAKALESWYWGWSWVQTWPSSLLSHVWCCQHWHKQGRPWTELSPSTCGTNTCWGNLPSLQVPFEWEVHPLCGFLGSAHSAVWVASIRTCKADSRALMG